MTKNTGRDYERFVAKLQQAIIDSEQFAQQKNIVVEINKVIKDNCGIDRQFDVYWEYELGGLVYKTVIECKDYESYIPIEKIDALIGKTRDIPDLRAVFATKKGYQSGALPKAFSHCIDLLVVRKENESDWKDEDGTPLVRSIEVNLVVLPPPQITYCEPQVDAEWLDQHPEIDPAPLSEGGMTNEIFIDDINAGVKYSLHELQDKLEPSDKEKEGEFETVLLYPHAYICSGSLRLKIKGLRLKYKIPMPHKTSFEVSKEIEGVIDYLKTGARKMIFRDGTIK